MKRLKLALWIIAITVIHIAFNRYVKIYDSAPDIFLAFALVYAVLETEVSYVISAAVICGIISCAFASDGFAVNMIVFTAGAAAVYEIDKKIKTIPKNLKAVLFTAAVTLLGEAAVSLAVSSAIGYSELLYVFAPAVIVNAAAAVIIYPIMRRTFGFDKIRSSFLAP